MLERRERLPSAATASVVIDPSLPIVNSQRPSGDGTSAKGRSTLENANWLASAFSDPSGWTS